MVFETVTIVPSSTTSLLACHLARAMASLRLRPESCSPCPARSTRSTTAMGKEMTSRTRASSISTGYFWGCVMEKPEPGANVVMVGGIAFNVSIWPQTGQAL